MSPARERRRLRLGGTLQGVGLRPALYRRAVALGLGGWVRNEGAGVTLELEGEPERLEAFRAGLREALPPGARLEELEEEPLPPLGEREFRVAPSAGGGRLSALQPDVVPCAACLAEVRDPAGRRHRYPFTSCSRCGPRWSVLLALPWDRPGSTLRDFPLCAACRAEYEDPADRRFHAQTLACPACGPTLELRGADGEARARAEPALAQAGALLGAGSLLLLKGLGGYQLVCRADAGPALERVRALKARPHKPLAVMAGLVWAEAVCRVDPAEREVLTDPAGPIVLLRRREQDAVHPAVAPGSALLGVMLPSSPLHLLLLEAAGAPLVVTSGNRGGEPLLVDDALAARELGPACDAVLTHDRPIARPLDDSVVRWAAGRPLLLRRARGYVPRPLELPVPLAPRLALGGHLKATVALGVGRVAHLSEHLGDLDGPRALARLRAAAEELTALEGVAPTALACDRHPDYASTREAERRGLALLRVQHHEAHVLAVLAEDPGQGPALGLAWDGSGWGQDGTLWGGEAFRVEGGRLRRRAHLRTFPLPGGVAAIREPRRAALGLLLEAGQPLPPALAGSFAPGEPALLERAAAAGLNAPRTSSVGRLFDAVAALLGLCSRQSFEGQAAALLEQACPAELPPDAYPLPLCETSDGLLEWDWAPLVAGLLSDLEAGVGVARLSGRFHAALIEGALALARREGLPRVALGGGCFQNAVLLEGLVSRLRQAGFTPCWPRQLPPNDGGLALGQLVAASGEG